MGNPDIGNYFLIGIKDNNDSSTNHLVNFSIHIIHRKREA